ncbi:putative RNA-directed DNA polymerase from transposon X-element [Trichonephila clavipes]|nr:putative RNA-directed DNA polymerase from transposon X-element [Trichonephila clavipes]
MPVETHLRFALMGKDTKSNQAKSLPTVNEQQKPRSAMSMLSNQILSLDVKELWSLKTNGIRAPVENLKGKKFNSESIKRFENELDIPLDGRKNLEVIERAPDNEIFKVGYYLPHRPILTPAKTIKIRLVFDATARERGKSYFNDMLHKGPSLIKLIPDILDRFRLYSIALSADIEKAFLQLAIAPEHRAGNFKNPADVLSKGCLLSATIVRFKMTIAGPAASAPVALPENRIRDERYSRGLRGFGGLYSSYVLMTNTTAEVIDLDLNDFAKFQRRVRFRAKLIKDLKSRFRKEYLGLLAQKPSKPISHKMKFFTNSSPHEFFSISSDLLLTKLALLQWEKSRAANSIALSGPESLHSRYPHPMDLSKHCYPIGLSPRQANSPFIPSSVDNRNPQLPPPSDRSL